MPDRSSSEPTSLPRATSSESISSLAVLRKGARGMVSSILDDGQGLGDSSQSTIGRRLLELGFCPGERVEVIEEIWPGGDPLAVRIGNSVFALRRREAALVLIAVEPGPE